ncbi:MAG TPA: FAD-dependent monooxygenase [Mycobacterium sp.]|nr:FAD-dependent monooxygenase [Mycobacterium sp.]HUH71098.1 FAD-dependent monooxygenase [Mycobacterium sp.]
MNQTDVLIVGAGPVGLMLACELRRRDIACGIIDKYAEFPSTSRANGVQPRAVEVLYSLGIADKIVAESYRAKGFRILRAGTEVGRIEPNIATDPGDLSDQPYHGMVFANQAVVEKALRDKLAELGDQVELQRELRSLQEYPDGIVADIADLASGNVEQVHAKWLVGCDGVHSAVRTLLQLPFTGKDYPDQFVQADVYLDGDLPEGLMTLWLNDQGLMAAIPFREPGLWRIAAQIFPDASGNIPRASVELFQRLLAERAADTTTKIVEPVWLSNFVVHHRIVDHYRKGHVFVAGDAAHVHSPIGGQGMNTGIQDAYNLAWKLALVINGAPETLLDSYEAERLPVGRKVLQQTDVNHRLRVSGSLLADVLMDHVVFPLLRVPAILDVVGDFVLKRGSQLDVNYRASSLSEHTGSYRKGPRAGDRAPDGQLLDPSGQPTSLFAQFRTPDFRLLLFQGRRQAADTKALAAIGQRVRVATDGLVRPLVITTDDATSRDDNVIVLNDPKQRTHVCYGASTPGLYLIRPDGYVGFRGYADDEAELLGYLQRHYGIVASTQAEALDTRIS